MASSHLPAVANLMAPAVESFGTESFTAALETAYRNCPADSIDFAILVAMRVLEAMGGRMIHAVEYSKPFDAPRNNQRLLYAFLPRLPESPGAFSEAQLRWINGHYPEDFAAACRGRVPGALSDIQM